MEVVPVRARTFARGVVLGFAALVASAGLARQSGAASENVFLEFDTTLEALDLTGGAFPIPLASDPVNALGDSIDGYAFVDSQVRITLSSQRTVNPGPATTGSATAFQEQPSLAESLQENGGLPVVDPNELDGLPFFVDSVFDVFFDIQVTDVDSRPGRNFAGQPDGASIFLMDNGPAQMSSVYEAIFDKDAYNFGLIPPPEADPYIGHFQIEIPLGGDINGNGENDKIKFTLASHSAGDENRQFTVLPDGTVINQFDSAAFLEGAIVDESTDPPFTIGARLPNGLPDPNAFGGPTTATSTLLNPVVPEPSSFALLALGTLGLCAHARGRCRS
jgi:hypothetical protein